MITRPLLLVGALLCLATSLPVASGQSRPSLYPDPGYRRLGVYGGGSSSHFDYRLIKLHLDDTFRDKKQWWQNLKAGRSTDAASPHDVFLLYPGIKRGADLEQARRRIDAWLKSEPDAETFPQLIPAVCLEEENGRQHDAVLDALARHIRQNYGLPVFQWYSMPLEPNPTLTADGWILDAYGMPPTQLRKHLMKFVALRRPVLCVPWATDPQWPGWKKFDSAAALIDAEWHQFDACLEFNVSPAAFAVAGAGSVNAWLAAKTPQMVALRDALAARRAAMHAVRPGDLPLASADFSARNGAVAVGGDPDEPSSYVEQFDSFRWIEDASLAGFQRMRLGSRPDEPGRLELLTIPGETVAGSLLYRLESYFPLQSVRVRLDASAPAAAQCRNHLALAREESADPPPLTAEQTAADKPAPLELVADNAFLQDTRVVYLRVAMTNRADKPGLPGNSLQRLVVQCVHRPPASPAAAPLEADAYGNLRYHDDFTTPRWKHLGQLDVEHKDRGGWRPGNFWVGLVGGRSARVHLVQRFTTARELTELRATVYCRADAKQLAGYASVAVAPRGGLPQWKASTEGPSRGTFRGPLTAEVPKADLKGLREFDVHVFLESRSGVDQPARSAASVSRLEIQAR